MSRMSMIDLVDDEATDPLIAGLDVETGIPEMSSFAGLDQVPELGGSCVTTGLEFAGGMH